MALTSPRKIQEIDGVKRALAMKGSTTIQKGALVVLDANRFAVPGSAAANLLSAGICDATTVNDGADGGATVPTRRGTFLFNNDGANPVTRSHINQDCFIVDDETVSSDNTGTSRAGTVFDVSDAGVWVSV